MELIERDELFKRIAKQETWNIPDFVYDEIRNAPTVKAIPIEWIKKWCNEHSRKSLEERLLKRCGVITLLEDWEKENGKE